MAHINLHMALGVLAGSAATVPLVAAAWRRSRPLGRPLGIALLITYSLGLWAIVPSLLAWAGCIEHPTTARWANVFVLHSWLDRREDQGLLIGEAIVAAHIVLHYLAILLALRARASER
jgi:hypothetical protein